MCLYSSFDNLFKVQWLTATKALVCCIQLHTEVHNYMVCMHLTIGPCTSVTVVVCVPGTHWDEAICYQPSCYIVESRDYALPSPCACLHWAKVGRGLIHGIITFLHDDHYCHMGVRSLYFLWLFGGQNSRKKDKGIII